MNATGRKGSWKPAEKLTVTAPVSCFNTRLDFLNNLSDGLTKKQKKPSTMELDYPPSPGSYRSYSQIGSKTHISSTSTTVSSKSSCDDVSLSSTKKTKKTSTWYLPLNDDIGAETPSSQTSVKDGDIKKENVLIKRMTGGRLVYGTSLKLQNGSKPISFRKRGKNGRESVDTSFVEDGSSTSNNTTDNYGNSNNNTMFSVRSEESDLSSSVNNYEEHLSDHYEERFSRTSSSLSNNSYSVDKMSLASLTLDSNYSTSEYASIRHSTLASNVTDFLPDERDKEMQLENERLATVLDNIDANILKEHLKKCLNSRKPSLATSLQTLLPKHKFTGQTSHCLRCHKDYDRRYGNKTCILRHPKRDVIMISEDDSSAVYQCERCTCVFKLQGVFTYSSKHVDVSQCGACYVGTHTDRPSDVQYKPSGFAKTCSEKGCAIFFV